MTSRQIITIGAREKWNATYKSMQTSAENSMGEALNAEITDINKDVLESARDSFEKHNVLSPSAQLQNILDNVIDKDSESLLLAERARMVNEKLDQAESPEVDNYASKLVKYIPTEVIAFYLGLTALVAEADPEQVIPYTIFIIAVGTISTFFYLKTVWKVTSYFQLIISCVVFVIWVIATDKNLLENMVTLKALMLPIVTFLLPLIDPPDGETLSFNDTDQ